MSNVDECYQYLQKIDESLDGLVKTVNLLLVNNLLEEIKVNNDDKKCEQEQINKEVKQYINRISELEYSISCHAREVNQYKNRISELERELNSIKKNLGNYS